MKNVIPRLVVCLLIPCMIADPSFAHGVESVRPYAFQSRFSQEAFAMPLAMERLSWHRHAAAQIRILLSPRHELFGRNTVGAAQAPGRGSTKAPIVVYAAWPKEYPSMVSELSAILRREEKPQDVIKQEPSEVRRNYVMNISTLEDLIDFLHGKESTQVLATFAARQSTDSKLIGTAVLYRQDDDSDSAVRSLVYVVPEARDQNIATDLHKLAFGWLSEHAPVLYKAEIFDWHGPYMGALQNAALQRGIRMHAPITEDGIHHYTIRFRDPKATVEDKWVTANAQLAALLIKQDAEFNTLRRALPAALARLADESIGPYRLLLDKPRLKMAAIEKDLHGPTANQELDELIHNFDFWTDHMPRLLSALSTAIAKDISRQTGNPEHDARIEHFYYPGWMQDDEFTVNVRSQGPFMHFSVGDTEFRFPETARRRITTEDNPVAPLEVLSGYEWRNVEDESYRNFMFSVFNVAYAEEAQNQWTPGQNPGLHVRMSVSPAVVVTWMGKKQMALGKEEYVSNLQEPAAVQQLYSKCFLLMSFVRSVMNPATRERALAIFKKDSYVEQMKGFFDLLQSTRTGLILLFATLVGGLALWRMGILGTAAHALSLLIVAVPVLFGMAISDSADPGEPDPPQSLNRQTQALWQKMEFGRSLLKNKDGLRAKSIFEEVMKGYRSIIDNTDFQKDEIGMQNIENARQRLKMAENFYRAAVELALVPALPPKPLDVGVRDLLSNIAGTLDPFDNLVALERRLPEMSQDQRIVFLYQLPWLGDWLHIRELMAYIFLTDSPRAQTVRRWLLTIAAVEDTTPYGLLAFEMLWSELPPSNVWSLHAILQNEIAYFNFWAISNSIMQAFAIARAREPQFALGTTEAERHEAINRIYQGWTLLLQRQRSNSRIALVAGNISKLAMAVYETVLKTPKAREDIPSSTIVSFEILYRNTLGVLSNIQDDSADEPLAILEALQWTIRLEEVIYSFTRLIPWSDMNTSGESRKDSYNRLSEVKTKMLIDFDIYPGDTTNTFKTIPSLQQAA